MTSGDKQWFDASSEELMMLNRLLIVPGAEHAMPNIGVNMCLLVQRPRGSLVLQGSHIMSAPGILWSTPPVHKVMEDTERLCLWCETFYSCSQEPGGGLVVAPAEKTSLLGSKFDRNSVVSSLSLLCLVSISLGDFLGGDFWTSVLLRLLLDLDTYEGVDPLGVFPLFLKKVADIIARKLNIIFLWAHPSGIVSGVLAVS